MELFRLKKLQIRENDIFSDVTFDFSHESDSLSISEPYFSVLIGPNGTGKSSVLKILIDIFRLAYEKKIEVNVQYYPKGKYCLEYFLTDGNYCILNTLGWKDGEENASGVKDDKNEKGIRFFKDGNEITADKLNLPKSILALSIMLTDRFIVLREPSQFPIYNYLGVRRDSSTAGTRSYIKRTIDYVYLAIQRDSFRSDLDNMLGFLQLEKEFYVSYSPKYKDHFFSGDLTVDYFEDFFINNKKYLTERETQPWSVDVFKKLQADKPRLIPELVALLNHLSSQLKTYDNSRSMYFEFDILKSDRKTLNQLPLLSYLHSLNIISYPAITLKKYRYYDLADSSSGEYHFISTFLGLLACISENSLILVDEPEISLHPNWQMKYIGFLNLLLRKYNSAHFIICTHSHFLVSDLKPQNSTLISISKDKEISAKPLSANTYGWSAEQILLEVFKTATTRNFFIAEKVGEILELVSHVNRDDRIIETKVKELLGYNVINLSNEDPLKPVIDRLIEKYV